jgi:cytochrome c-type biogenesis protein CcmF
MLLPWGVLAVLAGIAAYFLAPQSSWKVIAGVLGAVWIAVGTLRFVRTRFDQAGKQFTAEMLGMSLAHFGVAIFLIGALLTEGLSQQREVAVTQGGSVELGRYSFRFEGAERYQGPNYVGDRGTVTVFHNDAPVTVLHPEKRAYVSGGQVMTEAAIDPGFNRDLYVAMGEPLGGGTWALRVHVKPFVRWIWAGALLMMLGGFVTATDRRFARANAARTSETTA